LPAGIPDTRFSTTKMARTATTRITELLIVPGSRPQLIHSTDRYCEVAPSLCAGPEHATCRAGTAHDAACRQSVAAGSLARVLAQFRSTFSEVHAMTTLNEKPRPYCRLPDRAYLISTRRSSPAAALAVRADAREARVSPSGRAAPPGVWFVGRAAAGMRAGRTQSMPVLVGSVRTGFARDWQVNFNVPHLQVFVRDVGIGPRRFFVHRSWNMRAR